MQSEHYLVIGAVVVLILAVLWSRRGGKVAIPALRSIALQPTEHPLQTAFRTLRAEGEELGVERTRNRVANAFADDFESKLATFLAAPIQATPTPAAAKSSK